MIFDVLLAIVFNFYELPHVLGLANDLRIGTFFILTPPIPIPTPLKPTPATTCRAAYHPIAATAEGSATATPAKCHATEAASDIAPAKQQQLYAGTCATECPTTSARDGQQDYPCAHVRTQQIPAGENILVTVAL